MKLETPALSRYESETEKGRNEMFFENLKLAFSSMKSGRMRTFLSLLGIIIGVASVVTILNLGNSAKGSITNSITSSGYDILYLNPFPNLKTSDTFDELFGQTLINNVDGIDFVMPLNSDSTRIRYNKEIKTAAIVGVPSDYSSLMDYKTSSGNWFGVEDNIFKRQVVVLGSKIAEKLFPAGNAVGEYVTIYRDVGKRYQIVGVMESKEATLGTSFDNSIYIPYNTFTQRFRHVESVEMYVIKVSDGKNTASGNTAADPKAVSAAVSSYLDDLVGSDNYNLISSAMLADMVSEVTGTLSIFLAAIGGISLIVGGIGIMNIMLVSVAERTREIGIRKALGASPGVIKGQFLTEAIVLTSFGGFVGIITGIGLSKIIANVAGWGFSVSAEACVLSVVFSMAIGIFFGLYPAAKAAKLDPIESLNYE